MTDQVVEAAPVASPREKMSLGALSWALFEGGRNPYVVVCMIYIFAPYVAAHVIGDPVKGQEMIAAWYKFAGLIVAFTAPFLGAAADRMGRRKPLLLPVVLLMVPAIFIQYWALPNGAGLPLWALGAAIITASVLFSYTEVLHNSMLPSVAPPRLTPHVSGLGLALGNATAVIMLGGICVMFALPGNVDVSWLPSAPMFGLDSTTYEPNRISAPLVAVWFALFSIPLFLFTPDVRAGGMGFFQAAREGVASVLGTIRKLRDHSNAATFLIARMFYSDGKTAILIFGGVYAAGAMGWGLLEMSAFGIILSVFAVAGGFLGGWLDDLMGPKRAVVLEIGITFLCLVCMVSMSPTAIFFFIPVEEGRAVWNSPVFSTAPEVAYICVTMVVAISITAAYASSRTLLARLAPKGMEGELFGLYALAGSATVWLGPLLVENFTRAYHSLRIGFGSVGVLLLVGFFIVLFVKPPPEPT